MQATNTSQPTGQSTELPASTADQKTAIQKEGASYKHAASGFGFQYPKAWGKATEVKKYEGDTHVVQLQFSGLSKQNKVTVHKESNARIYTSFNAPSYCKLNPNSKWVPAGKYPPSAKDCPESTRITGAYDVSQFTKGAMDAYGFIEAFSFDGYIVAFQEDAVRADFSDGTGSPNETTIKRIKKNVGLQVDALVAAN